MEIPFLSLKSTNQQFEEFYQLALADFLSSGQYMLGNKVENFEKNFANFCKSKHCIGVANGLDALILILDSFGFERNAEVLVPANTYFASILAIKRASLKPVLIEPRLDDYLIDANKIEAAITLNTVAVMAVNLYGRMCDFENITKLCKKHSLKLIVDAAQSHGAEFANARNCIGADATAYSFYPTKNLGALSDAGAVVTDDEHIAASVRKNRNYGSEIKYQFDSIGMNSRLSELQASFLDIKLKHLSFEISKRRQIAERYLKEIKNDKLILPPSDRIDKDAWHLFVIRTDNRSELMNYLKDAQIGYDIHYPIPPHKQKAMPEFNHLHLPITEEIHRTVLSLPMNSGLKQEEVDFIISTLNSY
jgi:dTDP-4-amino-4,6-dideoxygalactose transaminase